MKCLLTGIAYYGSCTEHYAKVGKSFDCERKNKKKVRICLSNLMVNANAPWRVGEFHPWNSLEERGAMVFPTGKRLKTVVFQMEHHSSTPLPYYFCAFFSLSSLPSITKTLLLGSMVYRLSFGHLRTN